MKKLHLICNAHIDPIWQWPWDEGLASTLSTFKSAADLADEYDYIFCHGEALLYEAIEKHAPALFKRIQKLVKEGKWVITGGWYLQPDCLLPSGESFVRQIEVGQNYFREKFGKQPKVATNFDSFGHSVGLVQIMKKCGYVGMMACRPNFVWQFNYPSKFFSWVGPDGSKIVATNSASYSSRLGFAKDKILGEIGGSAASMLGSGDGFDQKTDCENVDYVLWGVGNHGGGPSRKDLKEIKELKVKDVQIIHSTPEQLFADDIKIGGEISTSLVTCMPGCYSSLARLKQTHREAENLFYSTEKMLAVAKLAGHNPDLKNWLAAEKKLLLSQFHDVLPGSCIETAEKEGLEALSMVKAIVKDYRAEAFLYLTLGEDAAKEGEFPVFVFNPMPYELTAPVEVEFSLADQNWSEETHFIPHVYTESGEEVCSQQIKEGSTLNLDWRKRVLFEGKLKPMGITKFSIFVKPESVKKQKKPAYDTLKLLNESGVLLGEAQLEIYEDTADPWGMSPNELKSLGKNPKPFRAMTAAESARFCGFEGEFSPVHTIEDGSVITSVETTHTAGFSNAAIEYRVYKNQPYVDLKVTLEHSEKNKLVRLKIPAPCGEVIGDGPYVVENKPKSGEITFQKWLGVKTESGEIFSVINDGSYAGKAENGYLYITLLRGSGYCMHPIADRELYPKDRYLPRVENGRYVFNFRIYRGNVADVCALAEEFNQKPYALNVFPSGEGKKSAVIKTDKNVVMPTFRIKNEGYEFRIFNPDGKSRTFTLTAENKQKSITLSPYEALTVEYDGDLLVDHDKNWI